MKDSNKVKVMYDHQIFTEQNYGGISRYFVEMQHEFKSQFDIESSIKLLFSNNEYLKNSEIFHFSIFPQIKSKNLTKGIRVINNLYSLGNIALGDFDVFHPTYFDTYFLDYLKNKPFVITVYDLIHERFSSQYTTMNQALIAKRKLLLSRANKIIAISLATKKDLIEFYNIDESKIEVIHLATEFSNSNTNLEFKNQLFSSPYILYVGNRGVYKNFSFFVESIASQLKENKELSLVCAGGGGFNPDEISLFKKLSIETQIKHKKFQTNIELISLYTNALAFFFPSKYEGFGIPVLEAFACGCPLAVSNISSLPEIAGDAAVYFDPNDQESIYLAAKKIINDKELREKLVMKGKKQLELFSWQKTAMAHKFLYQKIA